MGAPLVTLANTIWVFDITGDEALFFENKAPKLEELTACNNGKDGILVCSCYLTASIDQVL